MKLEYANLTCPKCGNGNYMRHLVGENVGKLNVKCVNCNSYFKLSDFYRMAGKAEAYTMTNADRIRAMSDEELAELFESWIQDCGCNNVPCHKSCEENREKWLRGLQSVSECKNHWLVWLKQEGET